MKKLISLTIVVLTVLALAFLVIAAPAGPGSVPSVEKEIAAGPMIDPAGVRLAAGPMIDPAGVRLA